MRKLSVIIAGLLIAVSASAANLESAPTSVNPDESTSASASKANTSEKKWKYKNWINVYKSNGSMDMEFDKGIVSGSQGTKGTFKGHYGFGGSIGHTFFIGKPFNNDFRFGIDATWLDFNYSKYQYEGDDDVEYSKLEFGMGVGPSITYQPAQDANFKVYLTVTPLVRNLQSTSGKERSTDHVYFNATAALGLNASFKNIGVGAEYRAGSLNNTSFVEMSMTNGSFGDWRFYLQLRF